MANEGNQPEEQEKKGKRQQAKEAIAKAGTAMKNGAEKGVEQGKGFFARLKTDKELRRKTASSAIKVAVPLTIGTIASGGLLPAVVAGVAFTVAAVRGVDAVLSNVPEGNKWYHKAAAGYRKAKSMVPVGKMMKKVNDLGWMPKTAIVGALSLCLLYTSDAADD